MEGLTPLEAAVLDMLLQGDEPLLATLRSQAEQARLVSKEYTGVGFFCDFEVPPEAPRTSGSFYIEDVNADIEGLQHGAGFVLFVRGGRLDSLEGFTYGEQWPEDIDSFKLTYQAKERLLPSG